MRYLIVLFFLFCVQLPVRAKDTIGSLDNLEDTEWKTECHQTGEYYFVSNLAFFEEHERIHSWKWYTDPSCKTNLVGEFWDKWKTISIKPSSLGPNIFEIKSILLDGYKLQCKISVSIFSKKENELYSGDRYEGTEKQLNCEELPTELHKTPFILFSTINQSAEEYAKTLKRAF